MRTGCDVVFETGNTWTSILAADEFILGILDKETRYPTPTAIAIEKGFQRPEGENSDQWDGWIRLLHRPKTMYPYFPSGLVPKCVRICQKFGYTPYVKDLRAKPELGFPELKAIPLRDYQEAAVIAGLKAERGVFDLPPRCHSLEDLVLLADGSVAKARDVTLGSRLMGPDGKARKVLECHNGRSFLYRVQPRWSDAFTVTGNTVLILEEHIRTGGITNRSWHRSRTEVSVDEWLTWPACRKRKSYLLYTGVPFPEKPLPIPPYLLGVLLGDGSILRTIAITSGVPEIQDAARELAAYFDLRVRIQLDKTKIRVPTYYLSQDDATSIRPNRCMAVLRRLGLGGKHSRQKFLPPIYLRACRRDRLDLLAGLLDTDGYLAKGGYYEFSTASRQMSLDVLYLARSLGFSALARPKVVKGWTYWRINILGDICQIPMRRRKKQTKHQSSWRKQGRSSFTVTSAGVGDFVGWALGGDHQYLTAGFVINHNSGKSRLACELQRRIALPTIWIAPTDRIVDQTAKVIAEFFGKNYGYHLVGSKDWKEASRHNIVICTMATAANLSQEFYDSRQMIICDEWHHCLHGETRVLTTLGARAIETLHVGELVLSGAGEQVVARKVLNVWKRTSPPTMLRIHTVRGVLEVTDEHRIYTRAGKCRAVDIRVGDYVSMPYLRPFAGISKEGSEAQTVLWGGSRSSEMPYLRKDCEDARDRRTRRQPFGEESVERPGKAQAHDAEKKPEQGVLPISFGENAWNQEPYQTIRCPSQDEHGYSGIDCRGEISSLRKGCGWKGEGDDHDREMDVVETFPRRVEVGAYREDREAQQYGQGNLVFSGFFDTREETGDRSGRLQPPISERTGREQKRMAGFGGMGGTQDPCEISEAVNSLGYGKVLQVERIPSRCLYVYDIEVEGTHNYFAEGVQVSNSACRSFTHEIFPKCDHIHFRYGMTGTNFRSGFDAMAMHGLLSNTIYKVSSTELLRRGFLVPTKVAFVPMPAHPKLRGAGAQFSGGFGKHGIHEHAYRNQLAANAALLLYQMGRKVLSLVGTKAQGREINHRIHHFLPQPPAGAEFEPVEFLSTDRPRDVQVRVIESFLADQEVKILLGTSLLGEGVDLPYVDALVYARGEKAEVSLTQNAYRVCTAVPGKHEAVIIDFADRHHRALLDHSEERLEVYYREPTFDVTVLDDANQLPMWLEKVVTKKG